MSETNGILEALAASKLFDPALFQDINQSAGNPLSNICEQCLKSSNQGDQIDRNVAVEKLDFLKQVVSNPEDLKSIDVLISKVSFDHIDDISAVVAKAFSESIGPTNHESKPAGLDAAIDAHLRQQRH